VKVFYDEQESNTMIEKGLRFLLTVSVVSFLVACGNTSSVSTEETNKTNDAEQATEEIKIEETLRILCFLTI